MESKLTMRGKTQVALLSFFLIGMITSLALADILIEEKIAADAFTNILTKLSSVYSVHLAIIIAGFFISAKGGADDAVENEKVSAIIILVLSFCWNFLIIITLINYSGSENTTYSQFIQRLDSVSGSINFLVAGGLTYYFGKRK